MTMRFAAFQNYLLTFQEKQRETIWNEWRKWNLAFWIASATLLYDPTFLKEYMFNNCLYLRKWALFCARLPLDTTGFQF
jgi:hypothetical protein